MPKALGKFWKWLGDFELIHFIIHTDFFRTLLLPLVLSGITAASGILGHQPVMWIVMAATLAFAATMQGLLRTSEYMERKSPFGKLRFIQTAVGIDLTGIAQPTKPQKITNISQLPKRTIDKMQLGIDLQNTATFPISILVVAAESEIDHLTPPRSHFPKGPMLILPGVIMRITDERIEMNNKTCEKLVGSYDLQLKYGLPGKERFDLRHASSLEIHIQPFGMVTHIVDSPKATSTLNPL
jgi:hypothetical protein